jgi:signal peptide peptidase SppA
MTTHQHVAAAVFDRPWAILPETLETITELVKVRLAGGRLTEDDVATRLSAASRVSGPRGGRHTSGVVAVLPLYGVLMPRANLMTAVSGVMSVEQFRATFREALADDSVGAIVLDVDSPGGSTSLIIETASEIHAARGRKPIVAVSNTMMGSAAYWIASAADEVLVSPSAMTGSIGVYIAHQETSRADDKAGITTTLIKAGRYKAEADGHAPLGTDARRHLQSIVDDAYGQFVDAVARHRGTTPAAVRSGYGEGRVLPAARAVSAGLADRIGTLEDAIGRAHARASGPGSLVGRRPAASIAARADDPRVEIELRRLKARSHGR